MRFSTRGRTFKAQGLSLGYLVSYIAPSELASSVSTLTTSTQLTGTITSIVSTAVA